MATNVTALNDLASWAWRLYREAEHMPHHPLVCPSMPILYFGDVERFAASPLKVMTVGINPSSAEFPKQDPFARFPELRRLDPSSLEGNGYRPYFKSLGNYFRTNPYGSWFATFEYLLKGMETNYYDVGAQYNHSHRPMLASWYRSHLEPAG